MIGEFSIGKWIWLRRTGNVQIKYKSSQDMRQVRADGRDDARSTYLGRMQGSISVQLTWKMDRDASGNKGPIDSYVGEMLADISSRGPNAGKAWAWVEDDQRIHNVNSVTVDVIETSRPPSSGSGTATLTLTSWAKPRLRPVVADTPADADPWAPGPKQTAPAGPPPPPGFGNNATAPKVTP